MAQRTCPVCRTSTSKKDYYAKAPEALRSAAWRFMECSECGLAYIPECPHNDSLYTPAYYGNRSGLARWVFEPFNRFWSRRKAARLLNEIPGKRWLDYGCGRGDLLEALAERKIESWGVETQKDCAEHLGQRWAGRIQTSLSALQPPQEGWDGIVLYHVLEHLEDPASTLAQLRRAASKEAGLFLAVPHWGAMERILFGDRWFHWDAPRHVEHFSPDNLRRLLESNGWECRSIQFKPTAYDFFGLFQTLLNLGPGPRNYFYRLLKRDDRFEESRTSQGIGLLWNMIAIMPAALLSLLAVPCLVMLRRTGTFEVVAWAKN